jgi:transcriptional regulator with XRE-family HTH domain
MAQAAPAWEELFRDKVSYLSRQFSSQSRLARLLEVDRSRVSRWLRAEVPDAANRAKLESLEFVFSRLTTFLNSQTAEKWLLGINAHLGNQRPIDLIRDGRVAEVIAALEQFETGAFA